MRHLLSLIVFATAPVLAQDSGWAHYGGDAGGQRHSALTQLHPGNVARLRIAWRYRTGELGRDAKRGDRLTFEATPVLWDETLYVSTAFGAVHAVDARSGRRRWQYDSGLDRTRHYAEVASRGVSLWHDAAAEADAACAHRVFLATLDARLIALDARDGQPCAAFGTAGEVDLREGVRATQPGEYTITSPPALLAGRVITGSAIGDNRGIELERGIVRAFDARSGNLLWSWDPIPSSDADPYWAEWGEAAARRTGGANAWGVLSVDAERDLVFVPTGSPSPDYFGGERPGDNHYANSLIALRGSTGELVWHRQLVHHDLWDYDLAAQPVLIDLHRNGANIPGVVQATKTGMLFVLHRETGEPLFHIEERPVPQGGAAGEQPSPTQPFSALPPLVSHAPVRPEDAWGLTFWDRGRCREIIAALRSEGIYTPPTLGGTLVYPGFAGGSNWGSVAFAAEQQLVIANLINLPFELQLTPREEARELLASGQAAPGEWARQEGTPYYMRRRALLSPLEMPCTPPPWGELAAVDLDSGTIRWKVPLGTVQDLAPAIFPNIRYGVPNIGGPIVTAGGLVFIGAAMDDYLRAFDLASGEELWKGRLPAGGQATPMTYAIDDRQYVVIAAGGHGGLGSRRGDYLVAFALPDVP